MALSTLYQNISECSAPKQKSMRKGFRPFHRIVGPVGLTAALAGCASSALILAPEAPDVAFRPVIASPSGDPAQISSGDAASGAHDYGLPPIADLPRPADGPRIDVAHIYTLAELIDLAQTSNPETRVAWERARQAALAVGIVKSLYLPFLSATAVGGSQRETGSAQGGGLPAANTSSDLGGTVSSVALQWLIFDFGERNALKRAAQDISLASNIAFNGVHQKIIYDVSRAFYDYTTARQRVAIAGQSKADSAHILDAASSRYAQGIGTSVETAQAKQLLAQANFDLVQARGAERDAYHTLLAAVGISPIAVLRIEDVSRRPLSPASMAPVERIIASAIASRADIQASYATAKAAQADIAAAKADLLPKVFITASDTYATGSLDITSLPSVPSLSPAGAAFPTLTPPTPSSVAIPRNLSSMIGNIPSNGNISSNINNVTVLGGVSFPIYDGGIRDARIYEARSRASAAEATLLRLQQNAATEIVAADDALRSSLAAYRAASVLVEASTVTQNAALAAYKSGLGTLTASIEAERALLVARLAQARAHGTALIAAATLAFSTGRLSSSNPVALRQRPSDWSPSR
jgi:outer membrane protein